jgi:hypothetical protein
MVRPNESTKGSRILAGTVAALAGAGLSLAACSSGGSEAPSPSESIEQSAEVSTLANETQLAASNEALAVSYEAVGSFSAETFGGVADEAQQEAIKKFIAAIRDAEEQVAIAERQIAESGEGTTYSDAQLFDLAQQIKNARGFIGGLEERYNTRFVGPGGEWLAGEEYLNANPDLVTMSTLNAPAITDQPQQRWNFQTKKPMYLYSDTITGNAAYVDLPEGVNDLSPKVGVFQSQWRDESYNVKNDPKYNWSNTPGSEINFNEIQVDGIGRIEARSITLDTEESIQPEAVVSNVNATGYFSRFAAFDMKNSITPTSWLNDIWGKSPEGLYADIAGGQNMAPNYPPDYDWFAYSKKENNNQVIEQAVYSGGYMANTDPAHPVCFGGGMFKISGNTVVLIKFVDEIGTDMNGTEGRAKLDALMESAAPKQVNIAGDGMVRRV